MNKLKKLKRLLDQASEKQLSLTKIKVYGYQYNYEVPFIKSISKFWFGKHEIEDYITPLNQESNHNNRPGILKKSIEYIVIHDTASVAKTADEYAHAKYVANGGGGTSWHYSVGSKMVYHQIPDNEIAYHAGDSLLVPFELFDTEIEGTNSCPKVSILNDFYMIDGQKSNIRIPVVTFEKDNDKLVYASDLIKQSKTAPSDAYEGQRYQITNIKINDAGIRVDLINGKYYMGPTYYNATYGLIANRGGNLNSIGIETMVNEGSNLIRTWHRCAKLVAHLLIDYQLGVDRVKPHHFFSGKPCPMTLRSNHLWNYFMELVDIEYQILKEFNDVKISLINCDESIDEEGLIKIDKIKTSIINYQIKLEDQNDVMIIDYQLKIKN